MSQPVEWGVEEELEELAKNEVLYKGWLICNYKKRNY